MRRIKFNECHCDSDLPVRQTGQKKQSLRDLLQVRLPRHFIPRNDSVKSFLALFCLMFLFAR